MARAHPSIRERYVLDLTVRRAELVLNWFAEPDSCWRIIVGVQPGDPRITQTVSLNTLYPNHKTARLVITNTTELDTSNYTCVGNNSCFTWYQNGTLEVICTLRSVSYSYLL